MILIFWNISIIILFLLAVWNYFKACHDWDKATDKMFISGIYALIGVVLLVTRIMVIFI